MKEKDLNIFMAKINGLCYYYSVYLIKGIELTFDKRDVICYNRGDDNESIRTFHGINKANWIV